MSVTIRTATQDDVNWLAPRLRLQDVKEIRLSTGLDPLTILGLGLSDSRPCRVFEINGELCGIMGVVPIVGLPTAGRVWMVGTPGISVHRRPFLRASRKAFADLVADYRHVGNWTWGNNRLHVRWIRWIGCKFADRIDIIKGEPFLYFSYENKSCVPPQQS